MFNVKLTNREDVKDINLAVNVEDPTWVNKDYAFMDLDKVTSVNITSSQMTAGCSICTTILTIIGLSFVEFVYAKPYVELITDNYPIPMNRSIFSLTDVSFVAQGSLQHMFETEEMFILLNNSNFNFIIEGSASFHKHVYFDVENVLTQCSTSKMVQLKTGSKQFIFKCSPVYEEKSKYSPEEVRLMFSGNQELKPNKTIVPSCLPCPTGAKCESDIQVLPNYWGYKVSNSSVSVIRCPDDYCCQGNDTCKGIDSCNTGRTGTLCGICKQDLTESVFSPECVFTETCKSGLVITLFISAALFYAVFLLSLGTIKNKLSCVLKKLSNALKRGCRICKERCRKDKSKGKNTKKEASIDGTERDESGLKYMQILFYYVQDSKLFAVHLPEVDAESENVVLKFLAFSPLIFETYVYATKICIVFSSAIVKVVFELSFRLLIMMFLCMIYLIQRFLAHYINKMLLAKLKVKLVQAFLLAVLLSYQKLLIGTFTLVQCVDIRSVSVLFIQADVECYTWWQICILIYICICVVPLFLVLAYLPFCIQTKKVSVKMFILACIFPLPVIIRCQFIRFYNRNASNTAQAENIPLSHVGIDDKSVTETDYEVHLPEVLDVSRIPARLKDTDNAFETGPFIEKKTMVTGHIAESHINASPKIQVEIDEADKAGNIVEFPEQSGALHSEDISVISEGKNIEQRQEINLGEAMAEVNQNEVNSCEEVIVETLQKHYKCLNLFGFRFTWLGVHMLYRLALVACRTFITEPVKRLYPMGTLVLAMTAANAIVKPYRDKRANITATLSYIANLSIAALNLVKANYVTFGCDTSCDFRKTLVQYMDTVENALLLYVPFAAIGLWVIYMGIQKLLEKKRR